jgi:hypothetical protein
LDELILLQKKQKAQGNGFSANRGTPIYATGDGIVKRADNRSLAMDDTYELIMVLVMLAFMLT